MHIFYFKEKLHRDTKKYRFYYTTQIKIKVPEKESRLKKLQCCNDYNHLHILHIYLLSKSSTLSCFNRV